MKVREARRHVQRLRRHIHQRGRRKAAQEMRLAIRMIAKRVWSLQRQRRICKVDLRGCRSEDEEFEHHGRFDVRDESNQNAQRDLMIRKQCIEPDWGFFGQRLFPSSRGGVKMLPHMCVWTQTCIAFTCAVFIVHTDAFTHIHFCKHACRCEHLRTFYVVDVRAQARCNQNSSALHTN